MKWGNAKHRPPREWITAYPNATWNLKNRDNYLNFIA